jgi:hypothetical protein
VRQRISGSRRSKENDIKEEKQDTLKPKTKRNNQIIKANFSKHERNRLANPTDKAVLSFGAFAVVGRVVVFGLVVVGRVVVRVVVLPSLHV